MKDLLTVVPVLGRPENVAPLIASHHATTPGPLCFVVDDDDEREMAAIEAAATDRTLTLRVRPGKTGRGTWPQKINKAWQEIGRGFTWQLCCADDVVFHDGWWEATSALRAESRIGVIGTNDLGNPRVIAGHHTTHPLVRSHYVHHRGTVDQRNRIVHGGYMHQFVDDELVGTAKARAAWGFCPGAVIEHMHPYWGKGETDNVYLLGDSTRRHDQLLWEERRPLVYQAGEPFPHMVIDDAIDPQVCQAIAAEMPPISDPRWKVFNTENERKWEGSDPSMWGPMTQKALEHFLSPQWCSFLSELSGIPGLMGDTLGGGYHLMPPGARLGMHIDFNTHLSEIAYRRLNHLLFLDDWEQEWEGELVLANREKYPWQRVLPARGRLAIFTTSEHSWHGVPEAIRCPDGRARRSLAMYYYTKEPPPGVDEGHSTVWA